MHFVHYGDDMKVLDLVAICLFLMWILSYLLFVLGILFGSYIITISFGLLDMCFALMSGVAAVLVTGFWKWTRSKCSKWGLALLYLTCALLVATTVGEVGFRVCSSIWYSASESYRNTRVEELLGEGEDGGYANTPVWPITGESLHVSEGRVAVEFYVPSYSRDYENGFVYVDDTGLLRALQKEGYWLREMEESWYYFSK